MWFHVASLESAGAISKMVGYTLHDPFNPPIKGWEKMGGP